METAITLLRLGETQSALTAANQAQEIFQALLAEQPDSTDFQGELSISYERVGDVQMSLGNLSGALTSYQAELAHMGNFCRRQECGGSARYSGEENNPGHPIQRKSEDQKRRMI